MTMRQTAAVVVGGLSFVALILVFVPFQHRAGVRILAVDSLSFHRTSVIHDLDTPSHFAPARTVIKSPRTTDQKDESKRKCMNDTTASPFNIDSRKQWIPDWYSQPDIGQVLSARKIGRASCRERV